MARRVKYRFASPGEVRQLPNGRFQYVESGKFAPEKNGRPLAPGFRKDSRGRVYNQAARAARARENFGLPPAPPKPPRRDRAPLKAAGLTLLTPPNIYTGEDLAEIPPEAKEAAEVIAEEKFKPGQKPVFGVYQITVARWAEDWASFVIAYDPKNPRNCKITASSGVTSFPEAAALNGGSQVKNPRYNVVGDLDPNEQDVEPDAAFYIVVPIRRIPAK